LSSALAHTQGCRKTDYLWVLKSDSLEEEKICAQVQKVGGA